MTSKHGELFARLDRQPLLPALLKRRPQRARVEVALLAVALFAAIFAVRLAVSTQYDPVLIFFAIPIALLSLEAGTRAGITGATAAVAMVGLWNVVANVNLTLIGYLSRVSTYFLVALLAGHLAERLRRARDAQQLLLDLVPESALTLDLDGEVTIGNSAAERLFGYGQGELTGLRMHSLMPDFFGVLQRSLLRRQSLADAVGVTGLSKEGGEVSVRATVQALASDAGVLLVRLQPAEAHESPPPVVETGTPPLA
jgi:PAS domain S-box-containing protein